MGDENKKEEIKVQADNNSIAIGNLSAGGNIGDVNIQTGYTTEQVAVLIAQIQSTFQPKPFGGRCPYKGLDVFEEEDTELFFGREKLVDDLVSRVKESRTVFVTGPSGSGKSSLVRAGLIHALKQGAIKGSDRWLYATMKPGRDPIGELGRVVSSLASSTNPEDEIRAKAMKDATIFARWCEIVLKEGRDKHLVLFIDQFEEVFTQISNEEERVAFLNLLTHAATIENGRVIILFSMRSDFVSNCATYPQLNALLNQQFVQIGAMQPEELVSAIAQPALRVGLRIDPDLIAQIINEMKGEPGALPLMQFALKDLFDSQHEKSGVPALILNDYLQRGGIHKALERHADDAFSKLNKNEQELARSIFSGLIEIGRGTQDTKRTALFNELVPAHTNAADVEAIVQKLADARLVTTEEDSDKYTITHEKLIDAWPWLKKLINENRDAITLQNEIADAAKEWNDNKRDASYLYSGGRLANIWEYAQKQKLALGQLAQEFISAGRRRQQQTRATLISAVSLVLIAAIVASIVFQNQARIAEANADEANKQTQIALARQLAAEAQSLNATRNSKQFISTLLAIQSMKMYPNEDAVSFLINKNLSATLVTNKSYGDSASKVAFTSDGKFAIIYSDDNSARILDSSTGVEIGHFLNSCGLENCFAISRDGKFFAINNDADTIQIRETATGKQVTIFTDTEDNLIFSLTFSPDGKYIASGGGYTARVWNIATGTEVAHMDHDGLVNSVFFSPDSKYIVSGGGTPGFFESDDNSVRVWEAATGREVARLTHDDDVRSVAFSPDGKLIVSGGDDRTARIWDATTGNEIVRITHDGIVNSVFFSPNGKYILSSSSDNTARVWETATGKEITRITDEGGIYSAAFSPDGKFIFSGGFDGTMHVWKVHSGSEIARIIQDTSINSVALSSNERYLATGSSDGIARVWDISTGKEVAHMIHEGLVFSVAFSPDGNYVVSGSGLTFELTEIGRISDFTARVWKAESGNEITYMEGGGTVSSVVFSPDGKSVALGGQGSEGIIVWDATAGTVKSRIVGNGSSVDSIAFSPDGKYIVSGGSEGMRAWEVATGDEVVRMAHDGAGNTVAFSPDGKYVISGSYEGTINVWDFATGLELARMTHDDSVNSIAFSPDGKFIVSGSSDDTTRIWEVATGSELARKTLDGSVNSVAFSPNGKYIVAGSIDGTARVWIWQPEDLITDACSRMPRNLTHAEWNQYIGDTLPYQAVCPNLPIEPEVTPTPIPTATP